MMTVSIHYQPYPPLWETGNTENGKTLLGVCTLEFRTLAHLPGYAVRDANQTDYAYRTYFVNALTGFVLNDATHEDG